MPRPPQPTEEELRIRQSASEIAAKLNETDKKPIRQIESVIRYCGLDFANGLLEEALQIEAKGGLMVIEGDRRRTLGGIFFFLARQRMPEDAKLDVFYTWMAKAKRHAQDEQIYPPFDWDKRKEVIDLLADEPGEIQTVKITLQGRPKALERRQHLMIATMVHEIPETITMPAGMPHPAPMVIPYLVLMSSKQWERAEEFLDKDENDQLVVEGFVAYDGEHEGMTVFAQEVTTIREIKKKKGEAKRQEQIRQAKEAKAQSKQSRTPGPSPRAPKREERPPRPHEPKLDRGHLGAPPAVQEVEVEVPDGMPADEAKKYVELHRAAMTYRQRISDIESKPADQQFGLEMTQKLLNNIDKQIDDIAKRYR